MQTLTDLIAANPALFTGAAAFLSGIALFYLVVQRTRKLRTDRTSETER